MPPIIFLYLYFGKTWFQIKKKWEKHWFFLCFHFLGHLLFSLWLVLAISAQCYPVSPFHSIHLSKFLASIRHLFHLQNLQLCLILQTDNYNRSHHHLQPSSPHLHHPPTIQSSILDSSFSALTLKITIVGQIVLLKKTTGCNWRRNKKLQWESGKMQKGG